MPVLYPILIVEGTGTAHPTMEVLIILALTTVAVVIAVGVVAIVAAGAVTTDFHYLVFVCSCWNGLLLSLKNLTTTSYPQEKKL